MRFPAVLNVLPLISLTPAAAADEEPALRIVSTETGHAGIVIHNVTSRWQPETTRVRILAPDTEENLNARRLLLVLPVEAGTGTRWGDGLEAIRKANLHNRFNLLCVTPTFSRLPWYADHPHDPMIRQETYLLDGVLLLVLEKYDVGEDPADRLLLGFSKSGWGAFSLLLRNPDTFGKAVAWDAPLMMASSGRYVSGPIFGTQTNFEKYRLSKLVNTARDRLGDQPRLIHIGYGNFRDDHVEFESLLNELNIPHIYQHGPKRDHHWNSGWVEDAVRLVTR